MTCSEFRDLAFDYLDGSLRDRAGFEDHFAACASCAGMLRGFEENERLLSLARVPAAPAELWPRIAAALSAGRPVAFRRPWWAALAAAAAAVLVVFSLFFAAAPAPSGGTLDVVVVDAGPALKPLVPRYEDVDTGTALADALTSPFRADH
jgi:hypothetical protein